MGGASGEERGEGKGHQAGRVAGQLQGFNGVTVQCGEYRGVQKVRGVKGVRSGRGCVCSAMLLIAGDECVGEKRTLEGL